MALSVEAARGLRAQGRPDPDEANRLLVEISHAADNTMFAEPDNPLLASHQNARQAQPMSWRERIARMLALQGRLGNGQ